MAIRVDMKAAREAAGVSQAKLSRELDCDVQTVANIENGKTSKLDLDKLDKICEVLGVEPGEIIKRSR